MKKNILIIFSILMSHFAYAQVSAENFTISSGGEATADLSGNLYFYDIGGLVVNTTTVGNNIMLTQGFEQPTSEVSDIVIFNPPNAFSPDGDGVNDQFILPLPDVMMDNSTVVIVNRWGDEISRIENYNNLDNVWDGTYQKSGELVTNGTYFYVVESTEAGRKFSGWVQVVR